MGKSGKKDSNKKYFWQKDKSKNNINSQSQTKDLLTVKDAENGYGVAGVTSDDNVFVPPDGGWGWVVCLASLWANGTVFGIINTFGIVYVQMREHYSQGDQEVSLKTAFVGSTCTGVTFLMCTVSSILSDRVGIRPTAMCGAVLAAIGLICSAFIEQIELLYLTYGVILGIGSALVYSPSLVILGHYFKKHMGLVNGIVAFGSSLFTMALTRILPWLLSTIGIKYVFVFLGGLHVVMIIFALSWKPLFKKEDHLASLTLSTESVYQHCGDCCSWTKRFLNVKIWRNKGYVTWIISLGVALFGYFVPFFHLPKYTQDNFPGEDGSVLILCLSITSGVSRIVCGKVADFPWMNRIKMQQAAFLGLGISTLCIPFASTFGGLIAISLVMGICDGIFVCLLGPIAFDLVGPGEASQAIGFVLGVFSIPFTVGPPLAGYLYDTMGDYRVAFHIAGAPPILGAIIMFFIPKTEQSFPAVTETMEFASMSVLDIYKEVKVPKDKQPVRHHHNGHPSGPATELEFIQSSELLYLGRSSPPAQHEDSSPPAPDIVITSPEEIQDTTENQSENVTETSPMLQAAEDIDENCDNDNQNNYNEDDNRGKTNSLDNLEKENAANGSVKLIIDKNADLDSKDRETEGFDNEQEGNDNQTEVPAHLESGSLAAEIGKYLETNNRISLEMDRDRQTSL